MTHLQFLTQKLCCFHSKCMAAPSALYAGRKPSLVELYLHPQPKQLIIDARQFTMS